MSSRLFLRTNIKPHTATLNTQRLPNILIVSTRKYHYLVHRFNGYKYSGHYSNIKIVDPNLERYSPLLMVPRKGFNRFSTFENVKQSLPLKWAAATVLSVILTGLCFTEKENWKSYEIANRIFYYIWKPFMEIMTFVLNLNVSGPKIEVPDKIAYHRDNDCKVITNVDFMNLNGESSENNDGNSDELVEPIKPLAD